MNNYFAFRLWTLPKQIKRPTPILIILLIIGLIACSGTTPPGPNSIAGVVEQASYLLLDCDEGMRILMWDDIPSGAHSSGAVSSTTDPLFQQNGEAQSADGRSYQYDFQTADCLDAQFTIDGIQYDLSKGKLFLIHTAVGANKVEQLDLDLSSLTPTNSGIMEFGWSTPKIAAMIRPVEEEAEIASCPEEYSGLEPLVESELSADPLPFSQKGYMIHTHCWQGQWFFTLSPGLNSARPCETPPASPISGRSSSYASQLEALMAAIDRMAPEQPVSWCASGQPDASVTSDIRFYSEQADLVLSILSDLAPGPTVTTAAAEPATPLPAVSTGIPQVDQAVATAAAEPATPLPAVSTGIPQVDRAVATILSGDAQSRRDLVGPVTAGCTHELGMGGPPKCQEGQAEGTPVQYLPLLGPGEGQHILSESLGSVLNFNALSLYAALRLAEPEYLDPYFPPGSYGLIFTTGQLPSPSDYILVHLNEVGEIVRLDFGALPLEPFVQSLSGEFLVKPDGFETGSSQAVETPEPAASVDPLAGLVYKREDGLYIIDKEGQSRFIIEHQNARISSDGLFVLFQPEYDPDIWLADLATGERRNLTDSSGRFHSDPQWWPGQPDLIITGSSQELGPGYGNPTVVRADGSGYQILDPEAGGPLSLSPDGQRLAYGGFDQAGRILHSDGTIEFFDPAGYGLAVEKVFQPAWSPDGQQLAWHVTADRETAGWAMGFAVFDQMTGTASLFHTFSPFGGGMVPHYLSWSPDGEWLAFATFNETAEQGRLPSLWIARPDGQDEIRLGTAIDPIWSPTGDRVAYNQIDDSLSANVVWTYDLVNNQFQQVLPEGTNVVEWHQPDDALYLYLPPPTE